MRSTKVFVKRNVKRQKTAEKEVSDILTYHSTEILHVTKCNFSK